MKQPLKSITELGPLLIFFAVYKFYGLIYATSALVITTIVAIAATYYAMRKIPLMPLMSALIVGFFGSLTIFSGNEIFIKLKPTLINLAFALILFAGAIKGKGLLKYLFDSALQMSERAWYVFSLRWAFFFLAMAVANEIAWRNFSTDVWVDFKVFGLLGFSFVFMATQIPFIKKHMYDGEVPNQ